jgi:hypothetical protein
MKVEESEESQILLLALAQLEHGGHELEGYCAPSSGNWQCFSTFWLSVTDALAAT